MLQLHEQIASDPYWAGPAAPSSERLPSLTNLYDCFTKGDILQGIDKAYREITERGAYTRPIEYGQGIELLSAGGILKVVEDTRTHYKKDTHGYRSGTAELFDARAQAMVDELLYTGERASLNVKTQTGLSDITRRTLYLQNAASGRQMLGKESDLLGRGGSEDNAIFMRNGIPVGDVIRYETRRESVERRIVSAEVVTPSGPRRARIFDLRVLGAKLAPAALPDVV